MRRSSTRGFTLLEIMAVVMMIGIFAAAAAPSFIAQMRDGRVRQASMQVSELYRMSRTRALANGRATRFVWDSSVGARGYLKVEQTTDVDPTCAATNWQLINDLNPSDSRYSLAQLQLKDSGGNSRPAGLVCFTPLGRAFLSPAPGMPMIPMPGVPRIVVTNSDTNFTRTVFLPPNGASRLAL